MAMALSIISVNALVNEVSATKGDPINGVYPIVSAGSCGTYSIRVHLDAQQVLSAFNQLRK